MSDAPRDSNFVPTVLLESSTNPGVVLPAKGDEVTGRLLVDLAGGGLGTVTSVSVVSANGFAGTVANATTTPAITLTTSINSPVLAGNGTAISAATTTGSGSTVVLATAPTLASTVTIGTAGGTTGAALFKGTTSGTVTLSVADAAGTWTMKLPTSAGTSGYVLQTDGSGNTSWVAQSGGSGMAIGGSITSATEGSVLFAGASGVLAQDNTNFFWDDTNNRLNLGNSSLVTTSKLKVKVTGTDTYNLFLEGTAGVVIPTIGFKHATDTNGVKMTGDDTGFAFANIGEGNTLYMMPGYPDSYWKSHASLAAKFHIQSHDGSSYLNSLVVTGGLVASGHATPVAQMDILSQTASVIGLKIKGAASQSANILEIQDSSAAKKLEVLDTGIMYLNRVSGTDYERLTLDFSTTTAYIKTEKGGAGTARALQITGDNGLSLISGSATLTLIAGGETLSIVGSGAGFDWNNLSSSIRIYANGNSGTITMRSPVIFGDGSTGGLIYAKDNFTFRSASGILWSSTSDPLGTADVGLVRDGAGVLRVSDASTGRGSLIVSTLEVGATSDTTISRVSAGVIAVEGVNVLTVAGGTLTGSITLGENTAIALDPAGSADGKWSGITMTATAGYAQTYGDLVYLDPTDSRWEKCDANSAAGADGDSRGIIGIVVVAGAADGSACTILLQGNIRADAAFPTFTVNNPIYVSETAGAVTQTQPTTTDVVIRVVGFALTTDEMYFNPSPDYITHT